LLIGEDYDIDFHGFINLPWINSGDIIEHYVLYLILQVVIVNALLASAYFVIYEDSNVSF